MGIEVTLTREQEDRAARLGWARQANAIRLGLRSRHNSGSAWGCNVESACAELAASIALGLPWRDCEIWDKPPVPKRADLGDDVEVRWTTSRPPVLNFDPKHDVDAWRYVLVSGYAPTFDVLAWIAGGACRRDRWRTVYPERVVYRVPLSAMVELRPQLSLVGDVR